MSLENQSVTEKSYIVVVLMAITGHTCQTWNDRIFSWQGKKKFKYQ
jgi:hypothetical protein